VTAVTAAERWIGVAALAAAAGVVYGVCLSYAPITRDELILLSSVARAPHPFVYFAGDWGLGNQMYRPLFSATGWVTYRLFHEWALPGQLLSLGLHVTVISLLFDLSARVGRAGSTVFYVLAASAALISPYTMTGASWVADRPTVMVAICLVLAVRELLLKNDGPRTWVLALCSIAALLSKESGVVVPALILLWGAMQGRRHLIVVGAATLVPYVLLRAALFGGRATAYPESGVLLGIWPYDNSSQLSWRQFAIMLIDNPARHVIATILPVFGSSGENPSMPDLWSGAPVWIPGLGALLLAFARPSPAQQIALLIVVLNACCHYALFRTRTMYLSQLGFVLYVAASPVMASAPRRRLAAILLMVLASWNAIGVREEMRGELARRSDALTNDEARDFKLDDEATIDRRILDAVVQRYHAR
jgi:hypothetical protein